MGLFAAPYAAALPWRLFAAGQGVGRAVILELVGEVRVIILDLHVGVVDQLLMSAVMCLISAWLAVKLHRACD